jgi:hypothetical protein
MKKKLEEKSTKKITTTKFITPPLSFLLKKSENNDSKVTAVKGKIRVGKYDFKNKIQPKTSGYTNILIHVKDSLSPYIMKDKNGILHENYWQFSKCYEKTRPQRQTVNRYTSELGWCHPAEKHYDKVTDQFTPAYWEWRKKGMQFQHPVRYPNGFDGRKDCLFVVTMASPSLSALMLDKKEEQTKEEVTKSGKRKIIDDNNNKETKEEEKKTKEIEKHKVIFNKLNIMEGRILVYYRKYAELCRADPFYIALKKRVDAGENIQINEVDGPPTISKDSNKSSSETKDQEQPFTEVVNGSIEITKDVAQKWVKQPRYSFGHGVCLAICLLDADEWLNELLSPHLL